MCIYIYTYISIHTLVYVHYVLGTLYVYNLCMYIYIYIISYTMNAISYAYNIMIVYTSYHMYSFWEASPALEVTERLKEVGIHFPQAAVASGSQVKTP